MKIIGILHLMHAPLLCIVPHLYVNSVVFDLRYVQYFMGIILSYTFTDGECPITLFYKRLMQDYAAIGQIHQYTDMYAVIPYPAIIARYVQLMMVCYCSTLGWVLIRSGIRVPYDVAIMLPIYSVFVHRFRHYDGLFELVQSLMSAVLIYHLFVEGWL